MKNYNSEMDLTQARSTITYNRDQGIRLCSEKNHEHEPMDQVLVKPNDGSVDSILCRFCAESRMKSNDNLRRYDIVKYVEEGDIIIKQKLIAAKQEILLKIQNAQDKCYQETKRYTENKESCERINAQLNKRLKEFVKEQASNLQVQHHFNVRANEAKTQKFTSILKVVQENLQVARQHQTLYGEGINGEQALVRRQEKEYQKQTEILSQLETALEQEPLINLRLQKLDMSGYPKAIKEMKRTVELSSSYLEY